MTGTSPEAIARARRELAELEAELARQTDALERMRRGLPWFAVEGVPRFLGVTGELTLAEVFEGRRQLLVCHLDSGSSCEGCRVWCERMARPEGGGEPDARVVAVTARPLEEALVWAREHGWDHGVLQSLDPSFDQRFGDPRSSRVRTSRGRTGEGASRVVSSFVLHEGQAYHMYSSLTVPA
ncbi:MAG: DUF899 family protein [Alphaproteobacteria bacterium]|nr:DUF899 family protein [Alphaproteobacteria bacterium]